MKKKLLAYIGLFISVFVLSLVASDVPQALGTSTFTEARSNSAGQDGVATTTLPFNNVTNNGTTTRSYIAVGNASTTLTANVGSADETWMYLHIVSSSSASTLRWEVEYSLDNADFYGEDMASSSVMNNVVKATFIDHSSTTPIHRWNPGRTATTTKMVKLPAGVGNYVRVSFSALGGNLSYWIDIIPKRNTN